MNNLKDVFQKDDIDREKEIQKFESQIRDFQNRINSVEDKFFDNAIDRTTYEEAKKRYQEKINSLKYKINEFSNSRTQTS